MPVYKYVCGKPREKRCKVAALPEAFFAGEDIGISLDFEDDRFTALTEDGQIDAKASVICQLVFHGMTEDRKIKCPVCDSKASRAIGKVQSYFPGNCYLNKADCKRHIMLDKLENDDPYGHFRPEGDKEALVKKIKRGDKAPAQNFYPGGKGGLKAPKPHKPE